MGGDSELQEDESKDHWGFNYGVTSELQKKWTSVDMEVTTESCALQRSARILALLLANYVLLPVLPNKTKLYLFMYKVESTFVLSSSVDISYLEWFRHCVPQWLKSITLIKGDSRIQRIITVLDHFCLNNLFKFSATTHTFSSDDRPEKNTR